MDDTTDLVTAAADLGRRDTERKLSSTTVHPDTALYVTRLRHDEHVVVTSMESHLDEPLTCRGSATVHDPADFVQYVNRLADEDSTTVWADPDRNRVVAVFDDHADHLSAGWRAHTATLVLQPDPDWQEWMAHDGQLRSQADFADQLESLAHTVIDPDPATMLEVATTFSAKRNVEFRSAQRVDNGDVELVYEETTKAKAGHTGTVEIPSRFTIRVAPFLGVAPAEISARLRYRVEGARLSIGYALVRPDLIRRDAVAAMVGTLRDGITAPIFLGTPPPPVTAR
jgi:uncharacterized protein YfdQ (DUF2303 family)